MTANGTPAIADAGKQDTCEHEWSIITAYDSDENAETYLQCGLCDKKQDDSNHEDVYIHSTRFVIADLPDELFEYKFRAPVHRSKWILGSNGW